MDGENGFEAFRIPPESSLIAYSQSASDQDAAGGARRTSKRGRLRPPRQQGAFIRGPIPLAWLDGALKLPGPTALRVALALHYQSGIEKSSKVRFTQKLMRLFRVCPRSASRSLNLMQAGGLLRVYHQSGRCREVELLTQNVGQSIVQCDDCEPGGECPDAK